MPAQKTTTLNLRVDPTIKEAVREAAQRENRSIANMIEVLIRRHCQAEGIPIPEQQALFKDEDDGWEDPACADSAEAWLDAQKQYLNLWIQMSKTKHGLDRETPRFGLFVMKTLVTRLRNMDAMMWNGFGRIAYMLSDEYLPKP